MQGGNQLPQRGDQADSTKPVILGTSSVRHSAVPAHPYAARPPLKRPRTATAADSQTLEPAPASRLPASSQQQLPTSYTPTLASGGSSASLAQHLHASPRGGSFYGGQNQRHDPNSPAPAAATRPSVLGRPAFGTPPPWLGSQPRALAGRTRFGASDVATSQLPSHQVAAADAAQRCVVCLPRLCPDQVMGHSLQCSNRKACLLRRRHCSRRAWVWQRHSHCCDTGSRVSVFQLPSLWAQAYSHVCLPCSATPWSVCTALWRLSHSLTSPPLQELPSSFSAAGSLPHAACRDVVWFCQSAALPGSAHARPQCAAWHFSVACMAAHALSGSPSGPSTKTCTHRPLSSCQCWRHSLAGRWHCRQPRRCQSTWHYQPAHPTCLQVHPLTMHRLAPFCSAVVIPYDQVLHTYYSRQANCTGAPLPAGLCGMQ